MQPLAIPCPACGQRIHRPDCELERTITEHEAAGAAGPVEWISLEELEAALERRAREAAGGGTDG
jgi:hypothetical protein